MAAGEDMDWTMGWAGGGSAGWAPRVPECVLGEGGGVGRLNLSGLVLLRGEGLYKRSIGEKGQLLKVIDIQPA